MVGLATADSISDLRCQYSEILCIFPWKIQHKTYWIF